MTIDELARRTGMTVRNIRAHQSRGLVSAPEVRGRTGYYGDEHVARIELIREMQAEGLNLAAIRRMLEGAGESSSEILDFTRDGVGRRVFALAAAAAVVAEHGHGGCEGAGQRQTRDARAMVTEGATDQHHARTLAELLERDVSAVGRSYFLHCWHFHSAILGGGAAESAILRRISQA